MELLPRDTRLIKRTYRLIRHRWIAISFLLVSTISVKMLMDIRIQDIALYCVCAVLIIENLIAEKILRSIIIQGSPNLYRSIKM